MALATWDDDDEEETPAPIKKAPQTKEEKPKEKVPVWLDKLHDYKPKVVPEYNSTCARCGAPALILFNSIECSKACKK